MVVVVDVVEVVVVVELFDVVTLKVDIVATCLPTDSCLLNRHGNVTEKSRKGHEKVTKRSRKPQ